MEIQTFISHPSCLELIYLSGKPSIIMARKCISYTEAFPMGPILLLMMSMAMPL